MVDDVVMGKVFYHYFGFLFHLLCHQLFLSIIRVVTIDFDPKEASAVNRSLE
jgi:hypothetical protein